MKSKSKISYFLIFIILLFAMPIAPHAQECCVCNTHSKTDETGLIRYVLPAFGVIEGLDAAFLFEGGSKQFRASGTFGWEATCQDFFKVTAEWLKQKNQFSFCTGNHHAWVKQDAVGIGYQHLFCHPFALAVEIGGSYSHAMGKDLSDLACTSTVIVNRNIAGSEAWDARIGGTFNTFCDGFFSVYGLYDCVKYQKKFHDDDYVKGFGGGVTLTQRIFPEVDLVGIIEMRRPYNYFEAHLDWKQTFFNRDMTFGILASHTHGRSKLGNNTVVGLNLAFDLNCKPYSYDCDPCCGDPAPPWNLGFDQWVSIPAVYKPRVLAIPEQLITAVIEPICPIPPPVTVTAVAPIEFWSAFLSIIPYDTSTLFSGTGLTYSATGMPPGISIDPTTGILTGSPDFTIDPPPFRGFSQPFNITVTATNSCGSAIAGVPALVSVTF